MVFVFNLMFNTNLLENHGLRGTSFQGLGGV
jgi:hypothetical protein